MPHIHELYDFTVSFYILSPNKNKVCLHYHKKLETWNQLGGHIELDQDPEEALVMELREEAGLHPNDYTIVETLKGPELPQNKQLTAPFSIIMWNYGDSDHKHIDLPYIIHSHTNELQPEEGESAQIDWFSREQVKEMYQKGDIQEPTYIIFEWIFENYC